MPSCFQLTRLGSREASSLNRIDDAICQHLDIPSHDSDYAEGWYDWIGFRLAIGWDWAKIADDLQEYIGRQTEPRWQDHGWKMLQISHFLQQNYTSDAWKEHKFG